jgi:hypothetical protein
VLRGPTARRWLLVLFGGALLTALGFVGAILARIGPGVVLHEAAGGILLLWIGPAVLVAVRFRVDDPRPLPRATVALVALVVAGGLGASLATTALPPDLAGAPLVPLVVLIVAVADGVRVSWSTPSSLRAES